MGTEMALSALTKIEQKALADAEFGLTREHLKFLAFPKWKVIDCECLGDGSLNESGRGRS